MDSNIENYIPQRAPFLFIDKIISKNNQAIETQLHLTGNEDFFKGHFPGNPIMPGVLMCEACFQSGAALLNTHDGLGVVTRIEQTKFKSLARPGDTLNISVKIIERLGDAIYLSGKITVKNKTIMQIKFAVMNYTE